MQEEEAFEDTKGVFRIRKSKDRQHNGKQNKGQTEEFEYTKGLIRIRKSMKGQKMYD